MNLLAEYSVNVHTAVQTCMQSMHTFAVQLAVGVIRVVTSSTQLLDQHKQD